MNNYTTSYGRTISARILGNVRRDILEGIDYQKTITDHLRDPIPVHDEDLDEANEVYNHVQALVDDEENDLASNCVFECEHGHVLCSKVQGGRCLDETLANR